ncbi:MAG: hypothetical protein ACREUG_04715 [Steroidobacteraceae bacterium]
MSSAENAVQTDTAPRKHPAYDPDNLDPIDAEARKHDDTSEGIDWDEIIATTQDDEEALREIAAERDLEAARSRY